MRTYFPRRLGQDFLDTLKQLGLAGDGGTGKDYWKEAGNQAFENFLDAIGDKVNVDSLSRDGDKWPGDFVTAFCFMEDILESNESDAPITSQHD